MLCDICDCDVHPNRVCPTCVNCIGSHVQWADYDHIHTEFVDRDGVTHEIQYDDEEIEEEVVLTGTKPHYRYNGKTGEITLVESQEPSAHKDDDWHMIAESFGL